MLHKRQGIVFLTLFLSLVGFVYSQDVRMGGVKVQTLFSAYAIATDLTFIDATHMLVSTKDGRIIYAKSDDNGETWRRVGNVGNIGGRIALDGDRGLMSIAYNKDNGWLYIAYVKQTGSNIKNNQMSRIKWTGDSLDWGSEQILFGRGCKNYGTWDLSYDCSPMPGTTHSIGSIWFNGGNVYFAVGDGEVEEGGFWQGQGIDVNVGTGWAPGLDWGFNGGKIWRMNYDGSGRKIVYRGLRNPFHCAPVPGQGGANAICGNVGWYTIESIMRIRDGGTGGWPCYEGWNKPDFNSWTPACQNYYGGGGGPGEVMYQWAHNGQSSAAIGGDFFSNLYGSYSGMFAFADYVQNWIRAVPKNGGGSRDIAFGADSPVAFRTSPDGIMYYIANCLPCGSQGQVRRFRPNGWAPPKKKTTSTTTTSKTSKTSKFTGSTSRTTTTSRDPNSTPTLVCNPTGYPKLPQLGFSTDSWFPVGPSWPDIKYTSNGGNGPIEINMSVGGKNPLDGQILSIGGVKFLQGLGTFGTSNFSLILNQRCYRLSGYVGCDDEAGLGCGGEWYIRDERRRGLFNSTLFGNMTLGRRRYVQSGDAPMFFEISNLQATKKLDLMVTKPYSNTLKTIDATKGHFDWTTLHLFCGPDAPFLPKVEIYDPTGVELWNIDSVVNLKARAWNYDGTEITDPSAFYWTGFIIHGQGSFYHQHPLVPMTGTNYTMVLADHYLDAGGQWYFYNARVQVTDSCGRSYWVDRNLKLNLGSRNVTSTTVKSTVKSTKTTIKSTKTTVKTTVKTTASTTSMSSSLSSTLSSTIDSSTSQTTPTMDLTSTTASTTETLSSMESTTTSDITSTSTTTV